MCVVPCRIQPAHPLPRSTRSRALHSPAASAATDAPGCSGSTAYADLAAAAGAGGVVAVGSTPLGRGLVATANAPARATLLSVPLDSALVLTDDPVESISIFGDRHQRRWQELHGALPQALQAFLQGDARWDVRMAAWLLWLQRLPGPLWRRYLAVLPPEQEMSCLLNYSDQEAEQLQVQQLQGEAKSQAEWVEYLHSRYFSPSTGELGALRLASDAAATTWATSMVRSRTFSDDVGGEGLTLMVPYADMANHTFFLENNATFAVAPGTDSFQLQALQAVRANEEVSICYGAAKPNAELLRDYGFVVPGNPHDRLVFAGSAGPKLHAPHLLKVNGFSGEPAEDDLSPLQPAPPGQELAFARRRCALLSLPLLSGEDVAAAGSGGGGGGLFSWPPKAWTSAGRPPPPQLTPALLPAERQAVATLKALAASQLAALGTSIATDEQLLGSLSSTNVAESGLLGAALASSWEAVEEAACVGPASATGHADGGGTRGDRGGAVAASVAAAALRPSAVARRRQLQGLNLARVATAVRARLEHKLLLREAVECLERYEQDLASG